MMVLPNASADLKATSLRDGLVGISVYLENALENTHNSNPASDLILVACGMVDMARSLATELVDLIAKEDEERRLKNAPVA